MVKVLPYFNSLSAFCPPIAVLVGPSVLMLEIFKLRREKSLSPSKVAAEFHSPTLSSPSAVVESKRTAL
jgi:hypothetical protein